MGDLLVKTLALSFYIEIYNNIFNSFNIIIAIIAYFELHKYSIVL